MDGWNVRWLGVVAALPLSWGVAVGQTLDIATPSPRAVVDPDHPADMVFEDMMIDFGRISDDESVEHTFVFRNAGTGTLVVSNVKGSCSCTVPALTKQEYAPGERGEMRVIFNPKSKAGTQHQTVTINSNDADTPLLMLHVEAYVRPQVLVEPRVGHFGEVLKDQSAEIELRVIGRNADFEVLGAELSAPEEFLVEVGPTEEIEIPLVEDPHATDSAAIDQTGEPAESPTEADPEPVATEKVRRCVIRVTMKPGQEVGLVRGKALTILTNDPKHERVGVELMAQHQGDLDMTPRRVTLGALAAAEQFHREVTIRSVTGAPFKVLGIDHTAVGVGSIDYSFSPMDPANPTAYLVEVWGEMPPDTATLRGRITVHTDVDREEELTLYYYGQLRRESAPAPVQN